MRYLIFAGAAIGDTIFELALAKQLKTSDPNAYVTLLVTSGRHSTEAVQAVASFSAWVDEIGAIGSHKLPNLLSKAFALRRANYDYSFICSPEFKATNKPIILSKLIGVECIAKNLDFYRIKPDILVDVDEDVNIVRQYEALGKVLFPNSHIDIAVLDNPNQANNYEGGSPIAAIVIGANITIYKKGKERIPKNIKKWDTEKWFELAHALNDRGYDVCVLGTETDLNGFDGSVFSSCGRNYIGKTSLRESLSLLSESAIAIGSDTGLMHCAAAFGVPTVSLFGGTPACVWAPYSKDNRVVTSNADCSPCYGKRYAIDCQTRRCMASISVSNVLDCIDDLKEIAQ